MPLISQPFLTPGFFLVLTACSGSDVISIIINYIHVCSLLKWVWPKTTLIVPELSIHSTSVFADLLLTTGFFFLVLNVCSGSDVISIHYQLVIRVGVS